MSSPAPAYQKLAEDLRSRIFSGDLVPGDRLPIEGELAATFGVSRSTVREALRSLSSENLVVTTRGVTGGTFVAHPATGLVTQSLANGLGLLSGADEISVSDLLEARELLEVPAARMAATRRSDAEVEELAEALPAKPGERLSPTFESSRNFHVVIVSIAGNPLIEVMTRPIFEVLQTRFLRDRAPKSFWRRVNAEHQAIYEAVASGDPNRAETEMRTHLVHLRGMYEKIDRSHVQ